MNLEIDIDNNVVTVTGRDENEEIISFVESEATVKIKEKILEVVALVEAQDNE